MMLRFILWYYTKIGPLNANNLRITLVAFLNTEIAYKYFSEGNAVRIRYQDGWQLNFEPNKNNQYMNKY